MTLQQRAAPIELMLSDVDGVLTDGSVVFDNQGIELKKFHITDGLGIQIWRKAGYRFGMITGRSSHIVRLRAAELGVELVRQGVEDKLTVVQQVVAELGLKLQQVCFIGDDLPDLAVVQQVGLGIAVADGCEELRRAAHYVTRRAGGRGAVREAIEMILKAQGRWDDFVQKYQGRPE
ncbi:MAG TPA: HAD hydrolase family protein [Pirellulales bacterium]|jgi:YrbI family 3-deoxy-D-manno-octulosonate 8-phosphate phosphatase|nr:HAD hydrolase family protein [Pirellulales bacterium]